MSCNGATRMSGRSPGKVFAIGGWQNENEELYVTFKVSDLSYDILKDQPGCRPAPYLASRGMKWIPAHRCVQPVGTPTSRITCARAIASCRSD